ncbi:unnamed protein product [Paramecium sonneborni]|uniref:RING-type domain-containing protein n=1 Tax=Paramecium sonneborni TaxID=65129 RepID=A0A8S1NRW7_9CILI|nr:unnamed protein product [Paramecium sonneborni]
MTGINQHWTCSNCETESILSPCQNCTNMNLRGLKENLSKCSCKTTNYYLDCKLCLTWYTLNESNNNLDGKITSCVFNCEQVQILKCTNCQSLKKIDNFNNEMKNYCNICSKYFFKQICPFCKEVSTFNQKESQLKQKCQNRKCGKPSILKAGKIQNQQVIIGEFTKANDIEQFQSPKQQQTSKFLQNLDLLGIDQDNDNTKPIANQNNSNLLDIDQNLDQYKSSITSCQKCQNSTELIITTPCGHKVSCYQCLGTVDNCISCSEPIKFRIMNTFNRDFYQEILDRIKQE